MERVKGIYNACLILFAVAWLLVFSADLHEQYRNELLRQENEALKQELAYCAVQQAAYKAKCDNLLALYEKDTESEWHEIPCAVCTAYCPCKVCCGKSDGITASGVKAMQGTTIACGDAIPFGAQVEIDGQLFICQDRGVDNGCVDIFFDRHQDAKNYGVQIHSVRWRKVDER